MTKIHNAFSSEEWKVDFDDKAMIEWDISTIDQKRIKAFFAAELEKKEKEVEHIVAGFVPEKKETENLNNNWDYRQGFNDAVDELNKNIGI